MHDDDDAEGGSCSHGHGGCGDLHLLKWKSQAGGTDTCLADSICSWIDARLAAGGKVLVHGYDGVTNSVAVALAFLMHKQQWRLSTALARVQELVQLPACQ